MPIYTVHEVRSHADLFKFIKFQNDLYKGCPQYVPSIYLDQIKTLTSNPALDYCTHKMWMVKQGRKVVGRICAMVNPRYNERYGTKRARFGWFDTIEDFEVARILLSTAEEWARSQGMTEVHGPLFFNTLGKQGMLVEGFENVPPFNCLYNYPYYNDYLTRLGYVKECDWIQYKIDLKTESPERLYRIADRLQERYGFVNGDVDTLKKDKAMVRKFFEQYSASFAQSVYNFIPFTEKEMDAEAKDAVPMLDGRISCFLLDKEGEIAAFAVTFASMSKYLQKAKGSLLRFALSMKKMRNDFEVIDLMINGAVPKWQNTGISSILHVILSRTCRAAGAKYAITNPQIETNKAINVWDSYGDKELYMRRRCYVKSL